MTVEDEVFDFGGALERMRAGKAVRRRAWKEGDHLFIYAVAIIVSCGRIDEFNWVPTQSDLLATDWETMKPDR